MPKIILPNDCACSQLAVTPKNWKTKRASTKKDWVISYRFYDPERGVKQRLIRGMNEYKNLKERQEATRILIKYEMYMLQEEGFNPFTGRSEKFPTGEISPYTPFIKALWAAYESIDNAQSTKKDIKCVIGGVEKVARAMGLESIPISDVTRKHIKLILDKCKISNHRFNQYRTYLMILFNELEQMEAIENDPVIKIKKKKTVKRIRPTLTLEERKKINLHLRENYYTFWRFMQIFFHSGSREVEILSVKYENVYLAEQKFKILVLKGKVYAEEWRPIKTIILPLWQEIMKEAKPGDYIFAEDLRPGKRDRPIIRDQITRRWREHVKKKLGIKADFYSLKHSNLDEVAEILSDQEAARLAGHKSMTITRKHYLINAEDRNLRRLKDVNNKFA